MWVAGGSILKEEAQKSFGDKAIRAIQLAMAREAVRQYRVNNQTGEDRPYHIAEREILKTFLENNILIERDGKLRLSTERFDEDLGRLFEDQFRQALSIYRRASTGNKQDLRVAKQEAGVLIGQKVPTALKIVKKQK